MTDAAEAKDWQQDSAVRAVVERLLLDQKAFQPKNTSRAYGPKQKEWRAWCTKHYPPVPEDWSAYAPWDGSPLPGELVDEGKLLIFMAAVAKRPPRTDKRLLREQAQRAAKAAGHPEDSDYYEPDSDREGFVTSALTLQYNSVRGYISAIQRLYEEQKTRGLNPAPRPQGIALKALKENILRQAWHQKRKELGDRGEGTLKDAYMPSQIPDHTTAVWLERKAVACAFRTQVDFLLGNHMLLRSSSRLPIELPDLFCLDLPNEGAQRNNGGSATKALLVLMRQGKTNQHGRIEYGAALRHRDPKACLVSALAFWFFWRWHIEGEPFPSLAHSVDWYDVKVLRQSRESATEQLSSQTANSWTRRMYQACGINTSKASHAPRVASSQNADLAGVSEASIRRAGRWNNGDQITGCYLTSLPREFMRVTADFDPEWPGSYYLPRSTVSPPAKLLIAIWPELELWKSRLESGAAEQNKAAGAFIELLEWLRLVLLQDAPFMMATFPDHPVFGQPIFHSITFLTFASRVKDACTQGHIEDQSLAIQKAIPAVAEKLRAVATQQLSSERLAERRHYELLTQLQQLTHVTEQYSKGSWHVLFSPNGRRYTQQYELSSPPGISSGSLVTPSPPAGPRLPSTIPLDGRPLDSEHPAVLAADHPPQYRLPRKTKSIVELLRLWRQGLGHMPSVDALESRWGARWRPSSEKPFFSTRKLIIEEVARRAAESGNTEEDVAKQMDKERGLASLDKVMKILRARRKQ